MNWLQKMIKDWKKEYEEIPSSNEARESFRLIAGFGKALGLTNEQFEEEWQFGNKEA